MAGNFVQCDQVVVNSGGAPGILPIGARGSFYQEMTTGANTLTSNPAYTTGTPADRLVWLRFYNTAGTYDYRYLITTAAGQIPTVLANSLNINTTGYGAPTFGNSAGHVTVTNAGWPVSGVHCQYKEISLDTYGWQV